MNDWALIAGGRCQGAPWRIGIAGAALEDLNQSFLLADDDWRQIQGLLNWLPLKSYGDANGLIFDRIVSADSADQYQAVLLVAWRRDRQVTLALSGHEQLYLFLPEAMEYPTEKFARVFLPPGQRGEATAQVQLTQPTDLPHSGLKARAFVKGQPRIYDGGSGVELNKAHFALCDTPQDQPGQLSAQWLKALAAGALPVHLSSWPVPEWFPQDAFLDAGQFADRQALDRFLKALSPDVYQAMCASLSDFLNGPDSYPYSIDCWINIFTSVIAEHAIEIRGLTPKLSVVIPAYNYGRFLRQAVQSVLNQGLDAVEILVLDNASTDDTRQVVAAFAGDSRVRYIRNRWNIGPGFNVQSGIRVATGEFLSLLMADDFLNPGHLQRLIGLLDANPQSALGYTPIRWVNESGAEVQVQRHPGYRHGDYVGGRNEVADLLVYDNYITPSAAVIRRSAYLAACNWERTLKGAGDWEMVIQLAERYPDFVFVNEPGVSYRLHGSQYSRGFYASTAPLEDHVLLLESVLQRGGAGRLQGRELEVAAHVQRRLSQFPNEFDTQLGRRARALCEQLKALVSEKKPLFSILLTTYNRPALLLDALRSLAAQRLQDFEVILVNDNGEPVEALLDGFEFALTYLRQGVNGGPAAARNAALRLARGRYIAYLDDDDLFLPEHLQTLASALEYQPNVVVYSNASFVTEKLEQGERTDLAREQRYVHDRYSKEQLFVDNYIPVNTFACARELVLAAGDFDETLTGLEDWEFLLRLASQADFVHLPDTTVEVRMRAPDEIDERRSERAAKDYAGLYQEIYRRHSDLGSERVREARAAKLRSLGVVAKGDPTPVRTWLSARKLTAPQQRLAKDYVTAHREDSARLTVILLDLDGDAALRQQSLDSLAVQVDAGNIAMQVMSVDAAPASSAVDWTQCSGQGWPAQLNAQLAQLDCDWVMLLRAGDELVASGLQMLSLELLANPDCRAIFADALFRQDGSDYGAALRPDFNLDYLLSFPRGLSANWLFRREALLSLGGFAEDAGEIIELDAILRLINQQGGVGLGHVAEPLVLSDAPVLNDSAAERAAVLRHVQARGYEHAQVQAVRPGQYRVDYGHVEQPLVSVVVIVQDQMAAAQRCVMSLLEHTRYPHYEILLIDNASEQDATREWLQSVEGMGSERLKVLRTPERLTNSDLCNQAALNAQGEYLLLLRAEVAVLDAGWLDALMNHALRPEVGAVGPRLVDSDGKITHAGLVLGLRGPASSPFVGEAADAPGYMQRLQVDHNPSALGDACLLVRKSVFVELGGLDAGALDGQAAVIDFCLRLADGGHLLVWTPSATLLHACEPGGMTVEVEDTLYQRWMPRLARDAAYNANFSLVRKGGFQLTDPQISWRPLDIWRPQPVVLAHPADVFGCGHYRVIQPFNALSEAGLVDGALSQGLMHAVDLERYSPDVVILQRQIGDERLEAMRRMKAFSSAFKVYELDDYLPNLPMKSVHRSQMPKDILRSLKRGLSLVDRFVVSTEPLADALSGYHPDIRVVHNRLDPRWWGQLPASPRGQARRPRVGWAGGASHTGDLELILDVVKELAAEVEWVFFGMCPDSLRPYVHEFHPGVAINLYPRKLAELNLDLALAPVEENLFNECKSNLRLLEYGACAYPVVCSDVRCYAGDLPVTRVKNRYRDWVDAIRMHLSDADASAAQGKALQQAVRDHWMLDEQGLVSWQQGWLP